MHKERYIYPNLKLKIYTTGTRQNRLAGMIGMDEAYLSRIINGFREPGRAVRAQIASVLGCDEEWLFQKMVVESAADTKQQIDR